MRGKAIQCMDRISKLLANKVQVTLTLILSQDKEVDMSCQLNSEPGGSTMLIKSLISEDPNIVVVATLNTPRAKREVSVRCMNLGTKPC